MALTEEEMSAAEIEYDETLEEGHYGVVPIVGIIYEPDLISPDGLSAIQHVHTLIRNDAESLSVTRSPGTVADDATIGTAAWANPSNAIASDGSFASATGIDNETSHYLKATNFGFTIPSGATIKGIVCEIEMRLTDDAVDCAVFGVRIVKGGVIGAENRSADATPNISAEGYKVYGSSSQLWGEEWAYSDINASNFGVVLSVKLDSSRDELSATVEVDHIRITVHYSE